MSHQHSVQTNAVHSRMALISDMDCLKMTASMTHVTAEAANKTNATSTVSTDLHLLSLPESIFERKQGCTTNDRPDGGCRLEFLHIPKTGGTAIEFAASWANISWGACKFNGEAFGNLCGGPDSLRRPAGNTKPKFMNHLDIDMYSSWHLPAHYYHLEEDNPYENAAIFAVVRNPYERVISEYFYMHEIVLFQENNGNDTIADLNNATKMNAWISDKLKRMRVVNKNNNNNADNEERLSSYFQNDGHFIPQYDFIYNEEHQRVVDHVLHFEHLNIEFPQLMQAYNLSFVHLSNLKHGEKQENKDNKQEQGESVIPKSKRVGWTVQSNSRYSPFD